MITKKEDMNPKQLEAFTNAMIFARTNTRDILVSHVLLLVLLIILNVVLYKEFTLPKEALYFMDFLTGVLIVSACNSKLMDESDRFRQEVQDILDNK